MKTVSRHTVIQNAHIFNIICVVLFTHLSLFLDRLRVIQGEFIASVLQSVCF